MTLILGTVANGAEPHVVVSGDGLSLARRNDRVFVCSGTTQKVWHFRHARAAVAHFGQNKLWDEPTKSWVGITEELSEMSGDESLFPVGHLSEMLVDAFSQRAATTILRQDSAPRFAFWIGSIDDAGCGLIEEVCWERSGNGEKTHLRRKTFGEKGKGIVAAAGDGHELVSPLYCERIDGQYYPEKLAEGGAESALEYHRRFLVAGLLEQSRQGKTVFGGKFLTVAISKEGGKAMTLDL